MNTAVLTFTIDETTTLKIHQEGDSPSDHFDDQEMAAEISKEAETKIWAWFEAEVESRLPGTELRASACIGCCSYENLEDFKTGGYYENLILESRKNLKEETEAVIRSFSENASLFS